MEIYANTQSGTWALVGKSKKPDAKKFQLCYIAQGLPNTPFTQEVWYRKYFQVAAL
ncbi:hypothetical protein [Pseudomonas sputi]|uniref:hypothetical protein n=1 Tax=Pseudomonas sputi TaxID=2892325 RepID=UPI001F20BCA7|nr:hypothetical protein [Pseudomonas sputi]